MNFAGLGFTFYVDDRALVASMDRLGGRFEGLEKSIGSSNNRLVQVEDQLGKVGKAGRAAGGSEGVGSLAQALTYIQTSKATESLLEIQRGVTETAFSSKDLALQFNLAGKKMEGRLGTTSKAFTGMRRSLEKATDETGVTQDQMLAMANAMTQAGVKVSDFTGQSDSIERTGARLMDLFGFGAEEAAKFTAEASQLGIGAQGLEAMMGGAAELQKKFQVTGLVERLPGLMAATRKQTMMLGPAFKGTGKTIIRQSIAIAATLRDSIGGSMEDAIAATSAFGDKLTDNAKTLRTFQARGGELSEEMQNMGHLFTLAGLTSTESFDLMAAGPTRMTDQLENLMVGSQRYLDAGGRMANLQTNLDEILGGNAEMIQLVLSRDMSRIQVMRDAEVAAADSQASFDKLKNSQYGALLEQIGLSKATVHYVRSLGFSDEAMEAAANTLGRMTKRVADFGTTLVNIINGTDKTHPRLKKILDIFAQLSLGMPGVVNVFKDLTKSMGFSDETVERLALVFGELGPVLASVGGAMLTLRLLGFRFEKVLVPLLQVIGKHGLVGSLGLLGSLAAKIALPLGILISLFMGFKDEVGPIWKILTDDTLTFEEKFLGVLARVGAGLRKSLDFFTFGLSEWLITFFSEKNGLQQIEGWLGKIWDKIKEYAPIVWKAVGDMIGKLGEAVAVYMPIVMKKVGEALNFLFTTATTFVRDQAPVLMETLITKLSEGWAAVSTWFTTEMLPGIEAFFLKIPGLVGNAIPFVIEKMYELITGIAGFLEVAIPRLGQLLITWWNWLFAQTVTFFTKTAPTLLLKLGQFLLSAAGRLLTGIIDSLVKHFPNATKAIEEFLGVNLIDLKDGIIETVSDMRAGLEQAIAIVTKFFDENIKPLIDKFGIAADKLRELMGYESSADKAARAGEEAVAIEQNRMTGLINLKEQQIRTATRTGQAPTMQTLQMVGLGQGIGSVTAEQVLADIIKAANKRRLEHGTGDQIRRIQSPLLPGEVEQTISAGPRRVPATPAAAVAAPAAAPPPPAGSPDMGALVQRAMSTVQPVGLGDDADELDMPVAPPARPGPLVIQQKVRFEPMEARRVFSMEQNRDQARRGVGY